MRGWGLLGVGVIFFFLAKSTNGVRKKWGGAAEQGRGAGWRKTPVACTNEREEGRKRPRREHFKVP